MAPKFHVHSESQETLVTVSGDLDVHSAGGLRRGFTDLFDSDAGQQRVVLLDLSAVDFIDSTGLGVIVAGHKGALRSGSRLEICGANQQNRRLFTVTGLDKVLTVREDETTSG